MRDLARASFGAVVAALIAACGSDDSGMVGKRTQTFASGEDWPSYAGSLDGPEGASLGKARAVCVVATVPANCPTDAVAFRTSGAGWSATASLAPSALWIWRADVSRDGLSDLQFAVFEKSFTLGANATGSIQVAADDFVEVRVNGTVVGSAGSVTDEATAYAGQSQVTTMDLTSALRVGDNTLTVIAQNGPQSFGSCASPCTFAVNTAGVIFGGTLSSD